MEAMARFKTELLRGYDAGGKDALTIKANRDGEAFLSDQVDLF